MYYLFVFLIYTATPLLLYFFSIEAYISLHPVRLKFME